MLFSSFFALQDETDEKHTAYRFCLLDFCELQSTILKLFSYRRYKLRKSTSQQALIKGKQRLVDFKHIVISVCDEILDDDIKFIAV